MKKLLGIVVLGLLLSSTGSADEDKYPRSWLKTNDLIEVPVNFIILEVDEIIKRKKTLTTPSKIYNFKTKTTEQDIKEDLEFANKIWDQAKFKFYIKSIKRRPANTKNLSEDIKWFKRYAPNTPQKKYKWDVGIANKKSNYIRMSNRRWKSYSNLIDWENLVKSPLISNNDALTVFYLPSLIPDDLSACGFAYNPLTAHGLPLSHYYGVIPHEHNCRDMKRALILSHEIGHMLAMPHSHYQGGNLMSPGYINNTISNTEITELQKIQFRRFYLNNQFK